MFFFLSTDKDVKYVIRIGIIGLLFPILHIDPHLMGSSDDTYLHIFCENLHPCARLADGELTSGYLRVSSTSPGIVVWLTFSGCFLLGKDRNGIFPPLQMQSHTYESKDCLCRLQNLAKKTKKEGKEKTAPKSDESNKFQPEACCIETTRWMLSQL